MPVSYSLATFESVNDTLGCGESSMMVEPRSMKAAKSRAKASAAAMPRATASASSALTSVLQKE